MQLGGARISGCAAKAAVTISETESKTEGDTQTENPVQRSSGKRFYTRFQIGELLN